MLKKGWIDAELHLLEASYIEGWLARKTVTSLSWLLGQVAIGVAQVITLGQYSKTCCICQLRQ